MCFEVVYFLCEVRIVMVVGGLGVVSFLLFVLDGEFV